jgi:hypothetical protein
MSGKPDIGAALLRMRGIENIRLILRSPPKAGVSKDEARNSSDEFIEATVRSFTGPGGKHASRPAD